MAQQGRKVGEETVLGVDLRSTSTHFLQSFKNAFSNRILDQKMLKMRISLKTMHIHAPLPNPLWHSVAGGGAPDLRVLTSA